MKKLRFFFLTIFIILVSCKEEKVEWFDLNIEFPGQVESFNDGKVPFYLTRFVNYLEHSTDKGATVYIPRITVKRMDVGVSKQLEVPFTSQAKLQKKLNMLSAQNVREGYKVDDIRFPDFLNKAKEDFEQDELKELNPASKNVIEISSDANKKQLDEANKQLERLLFKNNIRTITIRIIQEKNNTDETEETKNDEQDTQVTKNDEKTEPETEPEPEPKPKPIKPTTVTVGTTKFVKKKGTYYSSFARYDGGEEDGKAQGNGTMVFTKDHLIPVPPYSSKKIIAYKGYKLSGRFNKGYLVSGDLYDTNGKKVKVIYIGR